ncbi:MAG: RluA family pseudouridine synthase [bacterium]
MAKTTKLKILYEDNHLIAIDKPSGLLVQGDKTGDITLADLVKDYIKVEYNKPGDVFLGVIHRLDRPVSGVCLFARTSKALERMNEKFRNRELKKTYWALVSKRPEDYEGKLIHYLVKDHEKNKSKAFTKEKKNSKKAELSYKLIGELSGYSMLEINPITGRPHQIRVQLATALSPILGDTKYGYKDAFRDGSICLHAKQLEFEHPVKKEPVKISAPTPKHQMWNLFK